MEHLQAWQIATAARVAASPRARRWILVTLLVGIASTTFPMSLFGASLPLIAKDLGASESTITWVITAPILGFAVAMPILGKLGDLLGHRRVYLAGFAAATVVAALTATAWNAPALIGLRTLGQVTGAATGPASMAILMSTFPRDERAKAVGWWSLVTAGSPMIGLVAGGPLIDAFGWRILFVIQCVPAAIAVGLAYVVLPETARKIGVRLDVRGALALAIAASSALFALNRGGAWGFSHGLVLVALAAASLGVWGFVWIERRATHPLLPLEFFARPGFTAPILGQMFMSAPYMGGFILAPFLLAKEFHYSATAITLAVVARPLAFSASAPVAGAMAIRIGDRAAAVIGTSMVACSMPLLALGASLHSIVLVIAGFVLSGAGNGFSHPPFTASIANSVDESDLGIASASQTVIGQIGAAAGITAMTVIQGGRSSPGSFSRAFLAGGLSALAAVLVATRMPSRATARTEAELVVAGRS